MFTNTCRGIDTSTKKYRCNISNTLLFGNGTFLIVEKLSFESRSRRCVILCHIRYTAPSHLQPVESVFSISAARPRSYNISAKDPAAFRPCEAGGFPIVVYTLHEQLCSIPSFLHCFGAPRCEISTPCRLRMVILASRRWHVFI